MAKLRIVVIDDSESDVLLLKMCLDEIAPGYELTTLNDGAEALKFIEAERNHTLPVPCVIVLDIHFPKHDGLEILAAIRQTPELSHVKALVVSTTPTPDQRKKIEELGAPFAEKPNCLSKCEALAQRVLDLCETKHNIAA